MNKPLLAFKGGRFAGTQLSLRGQIELRLTFQYLVSDLALIFSHLRLLHDGAWHACRHGVIDPENLSSVLVGHVFELLSHLIVLQLIRHFSFLQQ